MPGPTRPDRSGRRRARIALLVLGGALLAAAVGGASLVAAVDTEMGRARLCRTLTEQVDASIRGTLRIGRCAAVGASHVRLEDVALRDPAGREVLAFGVASVRTDVDALSRGEVHLLDVSIERPRLRLERHDGRLDLEAALEPRAPPATEPAKRAPFAIDRLRVRGARIDSLPHGLALSGLSLELGASAAPALRVELRRLQFELSRAGRPIARLARAQGAIDLSPGGVSRLEAVVESGGERARLAATLGWTAAGPGPLHASLGLTVSPDLLRGLGLTEAAAALVAPVRATVVADGTLDDLRAQADLATAGGAVALTGRRAGDRLEVRAETARLEPARVLAAAGPGVVAVVLSASARPSATVPGEQDVEVTVTGARFDDLTIPRLTARGVVAPDHVRITDVALPHLTGSGGHLQLAARVGFDGAADVRLDASIPELSVDDNIRRRVPGLRGGVDARLQARVGAGPEAPVVVDGELVARRASVGGAFAERLELRGSVQGPRGALALSVDARARGLRGAGWSLPELELTAAGPLELPRVSGRLGLGRRRSARFDLAARVGRETVGLDGTADVRGVWPTPLRLVLDDLVIGPGPSVRGALRLGGGRLSVTASGTYRAAGPTTFEARVRGLDLAELDRAFALGRGLSGEAELEARLDTASRSFVAGARARLGGGGHLEAAVHGALAPVRELAAAARGAAWDAQLDVADLPAALADALVPVLGADGRIDVHLRADGTLAAPRLHLDAGARSAARRGLDALSIAGTADLDASRGLVRVTAASGPHRTLASLSLALPPPPRHPLDAGDLAAFFGGPWELRVTVPERRLADWPAQLTGAALPVRFGLDAQARGGAGPIEADAHATLAADLPRARPPAGCRAGPAPSLVADLSLRDGRAVLVAEGTLRGVRALEARLDAAAPVDAWMRRGLPAVLPSVRATARVAAVPLDAVPVLCESASGLAHATLRADGVFGAEPSVDVEGGVRGLRWGRGPATDLALAATLRRALATLRGTLRADGRDAVVGEGRWPIEWSRATPLPAATDAPWEATVRLDRAPLAPLLGALPGLAEPRGTLDGAVRLHGRGRDVQMDGALALQRLSFVLADPPLRVGGVDGRLRLSGDAIRLEGFSTRDGDGRLTVDGRVRLDGLTPRGVDLHLRAAHYPVRVSGVVFATVDGATSVQASLPEGGADRPTVRVTLDDLAVQVREPSARPLQGLDAHPDVVFEEGPTTPSRAHAAAAGRPAAGPPLRLELDATRPFWIRRRDFAVQLSADLALVSGPDGARITGPVHVRRGFLDLVLRRFELAPGTIRFDGGPDPSPVLDLRASHRLASRRTVSVRIQGRLPHPVLTYTTDVPGVETDIEILDLLGRDRGGFPTFRRGGAGRLVIDLGIASRAFSSATFEEPRSWSIDLGWAP